MAEFYIPPGAIPPGQGPPPGWQPPPPIVPPAAPPVAPDTEGEGEAPAAPPEYMPAGVVPLGQEPPAQAQPEQPKPPPVLTPEQQMERAVIYGQDIKLFEANPYDPAIQSFTLQDKIELAERLGVAYDRQRDLNENYFRTATGEYYPNEYLDSLREWAAENGIHEGNLIEVARKGGPGLVQTFLHQHQMDVEYQQAADWERNVLPTMSEEYQKAYKEKDWDTIRELDLKYQADAQEWQTTIESMRKDDPYMWGILTRDGRGVTDKSYKAYEAATEKRETDIRGIEGRTEARAAEQQRKQAVEQAIQEAIQPTDEPESLEVASMRYTPMDVTKAERALSDKVAEIVADNSDMSPEERGKLIKSLPEYAAYTRMLEISKTSGFSTRTVSDVLREAMSFGAVETPTYNRSDIERQYYQQKAVTLATFVGDEAKLATLYDKGYFGKGEEAAVAYQDALRTVSQQVALEDAVVQGDADALKTLYEQGAFGDDLASYANLVNYVNQGGRELAPVTSDDIKAVDKSFGMKSEYVKNVMDAMPSLGELSKGIAIGLVPVWGTIYHWGKMGTGMRAISIATDALSFIPIVGGVSAAAKVAAGVGRGARIAAGLKVIPKLAVAEVMAPVASLLHPVETAKALGTTAKGLVNVLNPRHIPGSTLSTVYSTVRLDTAILGNPAATMYIRDQLMALQATGKRPVVQFGDKVFTLRSGTFLSEGGVVHASPNIRFVGELEGFTVSTKTYPEGHPRAGQRMPDSEQGMFVANVALERFAVGGSAFGFEKGTASAAENIKAITDAAEQARTLGDVKKANKLTKLVDDYNAAIASKSIKALDKAESKIMSKLAEIAEGEVVAKINVARAAAGERYAIGDIKGAQEAMLEALSYEKQLQKARPGFAIFSLKVNEILVPSGKVYKGMIFQPKAGEFWSIAVREIKSDRAAQLLKQAQDATRLGDKATAARLTKEANDLIKNNKSGFRKVTTTEMELKFPELMQIQQLKPRYTTTASDTGAKLWMYTTEPYSLKKALKAKLKAPIDTLRNIYDPAIRVRTIPMTRAQRLTKIEELLEQAKAADKAGEAAQAKILRTEAKVIQRSLTVVKGVAKVDDIASAVARAERMDDAGELIQAAKRAESVGDYASADRLRRVADAIAGRRYVNAIARRAGTVSGLAEYARALGAMRLADSAIRDRTLARGDRTPGRVTGRSPAREPRATEARTGTTARELRSPESRRATDVARVIRKPEVARSPDAGRLPREGEPVRQVGGTPRVSVPPRTARTLETPRISKVPRTSETPRAPETPKTPKTPRIPRTPRTPEVRETTITRLRNQGVEMVGGEAKLPPGSITVKHGMFWRWATPPWNQPKMNTLPRGVAPLGAKNTDKRTVRETVQMIGEPGASVPEKVDADFGIVDFHIYDYGQRIEVGGKGMETNVGAGVDSTTQGMSVEDGGEGINRPAMTDYKPPRSVSRPAIAKTGKPVRGETSVSGINRPQIAEDTEAMLEGTYDEPELAEPIVENQEPEPEPEPGEDDFSDLVELSDDDVSDIFGVDVERDIMGDSERKPVNRTKISKQKPVRGQGNPSTTMGGVRS